MFKVVDFNILFSDGHNALELMLKHGTDQALGLINLHVNNREVSKESDDYKQCELKTKWKGDKKNDYILQLLDNNMINQIDKKLDTLCLDIPNVKEEDVDNTTQALTDTLLDSMSHCDMLNKINVHHCCKNKKKHFNWFNDECRRRKLEFEISRRRHRDARSEETLLEMKRLSKEYKKTIKRVKKNAEMVVIDQMKNFHTTDPKKFWNILNKNVSQRATPNDHITVEEFYEHFKELNEVDVDNGAVNVEDGPNIVHDFDNASLNETITIDEVRKTLKKMRNGKVYQTC